MATGIVSLLLTLVFVVVIGGFTVLVTGVSVAVPGYFLWRLYKSNAANNAILATGLRAPALVLDVATTGVTVNQSPQVRLRVEVQPIDGSRTFTAELTAYVSIVAIPRIQPGCIITVRYEAGNHANVAMESANPPS